MCKLPKGAIPLGRVVHGMGRPTGWVGFGWAELGWVEIFSFLVGWLGRGSEIFPKIIKLGRPFVTAEVIHDNLIMINTDK